MQTPTPSFSPAVANRAMRARWRHYRLHEVGTPFPSCGRPHDDLAAEARRKNGSTGRGDRLTVRGLSAALEDVQPLEDFRIIEEQIFG